MSVAGVEEENTAICAFTGFGNEGILNSATFFLKICHFESPGRFSAKRSILSLLQNISHSCKHDVTCTCSVLVN